MNNQVSIFDFDETLVLENSLGLMFQSIAGKSYWLAAIPAIAKSIISGQFGYRLRLNVKQALYAKFLMGVSKKNVYEAGLAAATNLTVNTVAMEKLIAASERGDVVIIATASPKVYVSAILDKLKVKYKLIIGTEIDFDTGKIIGKECSRDEKWSAVSRTIDCFKFDKSIAYGNSPDDIFMLNQVDEGFLVKGSKIWQY